MYIPYTINKHMQFILHAVSVSSDDEQATLLPYLA